MRCTFNTESSKNQSVEALIFLMQIFNERTIDDDNILRDIESMVCDFPMKIQPHDLVW